MTAHKERLKCVYCFLPPHLKSKTMGNYRVSITNTNFLILTCMRCRKKFKALMMGTFLTEADFNSSDRKD